MDVRQSFICLQCAYIQPVYYIAGEGVHLEPEAYASSVLREYICDVLVHEATQDLRASSYYYQHEARDKL